MSGLSPEQRATLRAAVVSLIVDVAILALAVYGAVQLVIVLARMLAASPAPSGTELSPADVFAVLAEAARITRDAAA